MTGQSYYEPIVRVSGSGGFSAKKVNVAESMDAFYKAITNYQLFRNSVRYAAPHEIIDWRQILEKFPEATPFAEACDSNGKCCAIQVVYNSKIVTMIVPPCQPFGLKNIESIDYSIPFDQVYPLIASNPVSVSNFGVWYNAGHLQEGLCLVCDTSRIPRKKYADSGKIFPFAIGDSSMKKKLSIFQKRKRDANILLQVMIWLWNHSNPDYVRGERRKFAEMTLRQREMILSTPGREKELVHIGVAELRDRVRPVAKTDTSGHNLSSVLPQIDDLGECIDFLETKWPLVFHDGCIWLDDKLEKKIFDYLIGYSRATLPKLPQDTVNLGNFYSNVLDFAEDENSCIFDSFDNFIASFVKEIKGENSIKIYEELPLNCQSFDHPYFYRLQENLFMVQNVSDGEIDRARGVIATWRQENGYNPGLDANPAELTDDISEIIYSRLEGVMTAVYAYQGTTDDEPYVYLRHPNGTYAAMIMI